MPKPTHDEIAFLPSNKAETPDDARLFPAPQFPPICPPAEIFDTPMKRHKFAVAVHEIGHALASFMTCNETQAIGITEINGAVRGGQFGDAAHGEDEAIICMAGLAAEQLIIGATRTIEGAETDLKNARKALRIEFIPESRINGTLQDIHSELQTIFQRDWLPGIIATATRLAQVGVMDWKDFVGGLSHAQRSAFHAGALTKCATLLIDDCSILKKALQRHRPSYASLLNDLELLQKNSPQRPQRAATWRFK